MLPKKILKKLDALILLLRPFWNRSRIVVATWLADNCIKFVAVSMHLLSQLTWNFYEERYYGCQNSRRVTSLEGQLVTSRAPKIAIHLCIYSHPFVAAA